MIEFLAQWAPTVPGFIVFCFLFYYLVMKPVMGIYDRGVNAGIEMESRRAALAEQPKRRHRPTPTTRRD